MELWIMNQDRDIMYLFDSADDTLYSAPNVRFGRIMSINLMLNDAVLGSFDTITECMEEMNAILQCTDRVYFISGHAEHKETKEDMYTLFSTMEGILDEMEEME